MPRALVTGISGFVGPYLAHHLASLGYEVFGTTLGSTVEGIDRIVTLDIRQANMVKNTVASICPDEIYHLAGISHPALNLISEFYDVNLHGTINVLEAGSRADAKMLIVSSAYVYGQHNSPISEKTPLAPVNHYGASKAAGDLAAIGYALNGARVVRVRPFNHSGPGQSPDFLLPTLVHQLARIEAGMEPPVIKLGNMESVRDFSDVRDIVQAYPRLLAQGENGGVYNLASGTGISVRELVEAVTRLSRVPVRVEVEQTRVRATDIPKLVGDATTASRLGAWQPHYDLAQTIGEMLEFEREHVC